VGQTQKVIRSGQRRLPSLRWEPAKAAIEFGVDVRTLLKKLEEARQYPDGQGAYSTRQLLAALYDDQYRQRSRLIAAQGEKLEINNALRRRELIPAGEVREFAHSVASQLRPVIIGLACPDADKQRVFMFLASLEDGTLLAQTPRKRSKLKAS
jgi:hypothetical protein